MKAGTSRDPSWWEYASDACSELDKGKGVALEDIIRHIDSELFAGQDRTCRSEVEAALTASVKSGHIFLSSVSTLSMFYEHVVCAAAGCGIGVWCGRFLTLHLHVARACFRRAGIRWRRTLAAHG